MAPQKTNESMNLDNQKQAVEQTQNNDIPDIIKKSKNYDTFHKTLNCIELKDEKNKVLEIFKQISNDDLQDYLDDNGELIDKKAIEDFIKWGKTKGVKEVKLDIAYAEKASLSDEGQKIKETKVEETGTKVDIQSEKTNEAQKKGLEVLDNNKNRYKEIFGENSEFFQLFEKYQDSELVTKLEEFLSKPENRKAVFEKLAQSGDEKLYNSTKLALENLSPSIKDSLKDIPDFPLRVPPEYFPTAKEGEVTKRGDIVSYGDASVDLKTGKAYITSENGYKLEAHVDKLDAMPTRIKFQKERLDILEKLETEKTFQKNAETTLKYIKEEKVFDKKKDLEKELENKKSEKKSPRKSANELQIDLEITHIERELELVNKKIEEIKKAFPKDPNQKEEDYIENLGNFLETKLSSSKQEIEKLEKQLEENKENYEKEISDLLEQNGKAVNDSLEKTRETTRFLNLIGFSMIPQEITDQIIKNVINTSQRNKPEIAELGFINNLNPGKSDLLGLNGLLGEDIVKQKKAFVKMFNKMMTGETEKPIPTSDSDLLNQEKEISHKYKQEINGILFKEPFEGTWKKGIMESNLYKTNKKENPQTQN